MTGPAPRHSAPALLLAMAGIAASAVPAAPAMCPSSTCPAPADWIQPFTFAGLEWERKVGCGGPGPNCWAAANVEEVPGEGIRLKLTRQSGRWYAAEMRTTAPVLPGNFSVQMVGRPDLLDRNVVLGVFLYDDAAGDAGDACPAELDLESSRFGDASAPNGHFVTYGEGVCGAADLGSFSYALNGTYTTHQIDWAPGAVSFRLLHGHRCAAESPDVLIAERRYESSLVPDAGGMRLHLNLWAFAGQAPSDQQEVDVTIRDVVTTCTAVAAAPAPAPPSDALSVRHEPSGAEAEIHFTLASAGRVSLAVVDVAGRRVATLADADLPAGRHRVRWSAGGVPAGVYFVRLVADGATQGRRLIVLD